MMGDGRIPSSICCRVDRKIKVGRPTQVTAGEIFALNLRDVPLNNGYTVAELARSASEALFAPDRVLYNVQLRNGTSLDMTFAELVNGAMVAGIVEKATSMAMRRDLESGKRGGLRRDDLMEAVQAAFHENLDLDHTDEVTDFVEAFRTDVSTIQRAVQAAA